MHATLLLAALLGQADGGTYILREEGQPDRKVELIPYVEPDPVKPAPHDHWAAVSKDPACVLSLGLRDPAEYDRYDNGASTPPSARMVYDAEAGGLRCDFAAGGPGSMPVGDQLYLPLPPTGSTAGGRELCVQWEAKWSAGFADPVARGFVNHKAFRFDLLRGDGDQRVIEFQMRYGAGDFLPTVRTYEPNADPIKVDKDFQPGGEVAPFRVLPETWTRFTASVTWEGGERRLRLWLADETRDPVLVIADPADPSRGFLTEKDGLVDEIDQFVPNLFNTSQTERPTADLHAWVRNVVAYRDATVPPGGKPLR
jgi:hypothetical protein